MKRPWWQRFLSRHFWLTVALLVISTVALWRHLLSGADFAGVASALTAVFRFGDAADTYVREGMYNGDGYGTFGPNQ